MKKKKIANEGTEESVQEKVKVKMHDKLYASKISHLKYLKIV